MFAYQQSQGLKSETSAREGSSNSPLLCPQLGSDLDDLDQLEELDPDNLPKNHSLYAHALVTNFDIMTLDIRDLVRKV